MQENSEVGQVHSEYNTCDVLLKRQLRSIFGIQYEGERNYVGKA